MVKRTKTFYSLWFFVPTSKKSLTQTTLKNTDLKCSCNSHFFFFFFVKMIVTLVDSDKGGLEQLITFSRLSMMSYSTPKRLNIIFNNDQMNSSELRHFKVHRILFFILYAYFFLNVYKKCIIEMFELYSCDSNRKFL